MKYVLVMGGVISGIGKGVIASSIGTILKECGLRVTSIKIDPYINIDAGTFSPYEHGEVYVLDDGGEVDLDLGNYERFLDIKLHASNNITTGKIYDAVIKKERKGDYLGKTVQVIPHITDQIQEWVESVSKCPVDGNDEEPEVCIIELGGTIGDIEIMPFAEAFRQFQFRVGRENMCAVLVSLVLQPSSTGELKTKPTQASVRQVRSLGLSPDFVVCRSEKPIGTVIKEKISKTCGIDERQVICLHDATSIYLVPIMLEEQYISSILNERLNLKLPNKRPDNFMKKWHYLTSKLEKMTKVVTIALVGKYTQLMDAYASVIKALQHSSMACGHKLDLKLVDAEDLEEKAKEERPPNYFKAWEDVCSSQGIIVPGGFGSRGVEGKIAVCKWARTKNVPFLGICLGMQLAVVEFARNKLLWADADSQEMNPDGKRNVVIEMPEHNPGDMGGTMRLGNRRTMFNSKSNGSIIKRLYDNKDYVDERHRHRYEVNPVHVSEFEKMGLHFVGEDINGERMEILELENHCYFVGCQYHPEYLSRPLKPSPPYLGFILASTKKLKAYLSRESKLSSVCSVQSSGDEEKLTLIDLVDSLAASSGSSGSSYFAYSLPASSASSVTSNTD